MVAISFATGAVRQ